MIGRRRRRGLHRRDGGEGAGEEALHVAGAAAVEPAVAGGEGEGVGGPGLALDRHHVGVAGEHDAALGRGADERGERGLVAAGVGVAEARDAEAGEIVLDEADQVEVGAGGHRRKRDETGQHLAR